MTMTSNFELLSHEIELGMSGKNVGVPTGFDRFSKHVGIRKSMYFLIGGLTGSK